MQAQREVATTTWRDSTYSARLLETRRIDSQAAMIHSQRSKPASELGLSSSLGRLQQLGLLQQSQPRQQQPTRGTQASRVSTYCQQAVGLGRRGGINPLAAADLWPLSTMTARLRFRHCPTPSHSSAPCARKALPGGAIYCVILRQSISKRGNISAPSARSGFRGKAISRRT